jgi:hypothetical protein
LNRRPLFVSVLAYLVLHALTFPPPALSAAELDPAPTVARLNPTPAPVPFSAGEELRFELRWMGLPAGSASMAIRGPLRREGRDVYHIMTIAQSSPFFSVFYPVRDVGESYVDVHGLYPWYFQLDQREGRHIVQRTVTFDRHRGVAVYTKNQEPAREIEVPPDVQDSLSSFYVLRTLPLRVGEATSLKTFANGRTYDVEVQVLRRDRVEVYWGPTEALVIRPILRFQEILRQKGDVLIWLTDDARRLPVRMTTAIKVGTIEAMLVDVKGAR